MMWGNWKKKIGKLFSDNELDKHQEKDQENRNLNVKAKMTYQYPKKKSFRFPVIPDQHTSPSEHSPRAERPAYERRRSEIKRVEPIRTRKKPDNTKENKIYKKDTDTPFKPTEVPSPIYGYQPRKKRNEIENVPAYKRKQEKFKELTKEKEELPFESESKGFQQAAAGLSLSDRENNKESRRNQQKTEDTIIERTVTDMERDHTSSSKSNEEKITPTNNVENIKEKKDFLTSTEGTAVPAHERKESAHQRPTNDRLKGTQQKTRSNQPKEKNDTYRKHSRKRKRSHHQSNHIPFNVMMTQGDKKKQLEREKQKEITFTEKKRMKRIPYHLLDDKEESNNEDHRWIRQQRELLEETLKHFNVRASVVNATQGPAVTRFEVQPEMGVKVSKVKNLSDDIKLNMAARDIRIEAPIPGKRTIGIEIPNKKARKVGLQGIFETDAFKNNSTPLPIALGLNIEGTPLITNIQKMPHGLIAGATGSGKSVCINTMLISLLYKANYEDVKFLLIDPKMVELAPYNGIPHLVSPVITDVKAATQALKWAVREMEERYEKFVEEGVRDIERYNQKVTAQGRQDDKMPFIVIVIDELADLMMVAPQDVEDAISRIAQKARACGIHLLLATQRPSVDVITGLIKANIPTRIAFSVSSQVDSRTILDTSGAEKLLGKGDMLFIENGTGKSIRLQGPFVSDEEIERVTGYARTLAEPEYLFEQEELLKEVSMEETEDELLQDAIAFVLNQRTASTSLLQRHYKIGYNRAARLIDNLENKGIISGQNGSKPREVLVTETQLEEKY